MPTHLRAWLHALRRRGNANTRQRGYGIKGDMLGPRGTARSPIVKKVPTTWTAVALRSGQGAGREAGNRTSFAVGFTPGLVTASEEHMGGDMGPRVTHALRILTRVQNQPNQPQAARSCCVGLHGPLTERTTGCGSWRGQAWPRFCPCTSSFCRPTCHMCRPSTAIPH